ncbi:4Fe-4S binding protein [Tindallia californiensis]|uniref:4Fe-4S binding domain-containing protein n=1 Tax=Tindallia californiensis TaxID=159292 RepID=A0A1H3Q5X0_9FIRM|nr:4Fe-4S binding protein [Tindallia californiensis]SDZ08415.1 4Fe-4S binding domain-containing protein [Tindallia californiensis]
MSGKYMKTNRTFTSLRKYAWFFTVLVALGGLWEPKLGLMVILIMAGLMGTSFFKGRYWCGNVCPHGSLFDVVMLPLSQNRKIPSFLKSKAFILAFFAFFMVNFGRRIMGAIQAWGSYDFLDQLGFVFVVTYLMVMVVGSLVAVLGNPRIWCQFCPMGTMQKAVYSISKKVADIHKKSDTLVTISDENKCKHCDKCEKVCPMQLAPQKNWNSQGQFEDINCIKCETCVVNCPMKILSMEQPKEEEQAG